MHHRKEDVERCKQKDLLEEMLREMTGEFPALSEVFVSERDLFLANSLQLAARPVPHPTNGKLPSISITRPVVNMNIYLPIAN